MNKLVSLIASLFIVLPSFANTSADSIASMQKACGFVNFDGCKAGSEERQKSFKDALVKINERPLGEQIEELKICEFKNGFSAIKVTVEEGEGYQTIHQMCYRDDGSLALYAFSPDYSSHSMSGANKNYKGELFALYATDGKLQKVEGKKTISYIEMKKPSSTQRISKLEDENFDSFRIKPVMKLQK